jgi:hypothetical protein
MQQMELEVASNIWKVCPSCDVMMADEAFSAPLAGKSSRITFCNREIASRNLKKGFRMTSTQ